MGERLTQGDIDKIKKEIEYRTLVVRKEAIEAVSEARAQGDLSENFVLKQCKVKFANCYQLNGGVSNIPVFVDKFLNRLAFGHLSFDAWYHLSGQCMLDSTRCLYQQLSQMTVSCFGYSKSVYIV